MRDLDIHPIIPVSALLLRRLALKSKVTLYRLPFNSRSINSIRVMMRFSVVP